MFTLQKAGSYRDTSKYAGRKRAHYLANRDRILAAHKAKKEAEKALGEPPPAHTGPHAIDADTVEDFRPLMERDRREAMEGIRLRLIWASSAGGDDGIVAKTAASVIRFAEKEGGRWTDRALRTLHRRLAMAEGLTYERFEESRRTLSHDLFIPL